MEFQKEVIKLYNTKIQSIWVYTFDEGIDNELILNPGCIYFEINGKLLKITDVEGEGKLELNISDNINYTPEVNVSYKVDLRNYVLDYPETDYCIEKLGVINLEDDNDRIVCTAMQLNTYTENYGMQDIFIHSGLYGLRIGNMDKKDNWVKNWYKPIYGDIILQKWFV